MRTSEPEEMDPCMFLLLTSYTDTNCRNNLYRDRGGFVLSTSCGTAVTTESRHHVFYKIQNPLHFSLLAFTNK